MLEALMYYTLAFLFMFVWSGLVGGLMGSIAELSGTAVDRPFIIFVTVAISVYAYFAWYIPQGSAPALGIVSGVLCGLLWVRRQAQNP